MPKLSVFESVTLDGYFTGANGDLQWAHKQDPEWNEFVSGNASGNGTLVFGRVTYEMMANYWPTPAAFQNMPTVAEGMRRSQKIVFSRTLNSVSWQNTTLVKGDVVSEMRKLKAAPGSDMVVLGSGSIVAQCSQAGLIDAYQLALIPVAIGTGRTLFEGLEKPVALKLSRSRAFKNGNVVLWYARAD
jgi:dihydrofolate reductase